MNQLLNKLERKYGKYAVPDLIKYVIVLYCAGAALGLIDNRIYYNYLSLNVEAVLHGQVWRLVTYLIEPYGFNTGMGFIVSILFFAIQVNLFFLFGRSLERAWGTFRFNMYFISGWLLNTSFRTVSVRLPVYLLVYVFCFCGRKFKYGILILVCTSDQGEMACGSGCGIPDLLCS